MVWSSTKEVRRQLTIKSKCNPNFKLNKKLFIPWPAHEERVRVVPFLEGAYTATIWCNQVKGLDKSLSKHDKYEPKLN